MERNSIRKTHNAENLHKVALKHCSAVPERYDNGIDSQ